eukprot:TRINITY_DN32472_c0_g1_i1.p1 TRINITY_DN32472_c0_g1~~TRINITY_DN32472_c0_g1_i1.p1  ORF type:complete len:365 (+),score=39.99 TRINITY_DN32472_c0_g1_i1:115-1209(+)
MIRRPPRSTLSSSSAASDVYKRQGINAEYGGRLDIAMDPRTADTHLSPSTTESTRLMLRAGSGSLWDVLILRVVLLGTADPGSALHLLWKQHRLLRLMSDLIVEPEIFVMSADRYTGGMPASRREVSEARVAFSGASCFLVSKQYCTESAQTPSGLDQKRLKWDVMRGSFVTHGNVVRCDWHVHVQRQVTRENEFSGGHRCQTRESYRDTGWEVMDRRASMKWSRIPLNGGGKDTWRSAQLGLEGYAVGQELLTGRVELLDDSGDWDQDEIEHWYPHWKLLGLRMHGLYTGADWYGPDCDGGDLDLSLTVDDLNLLFGFSNEGPLGMGCTRGADALWRPRSYPDGADLADPETEQDGFVFVGQN